MSEIKSTLELVLEKTRNMTLSEEDRQEQTVHEFREKVNGLLHKQLEGFFGLEGFEQEFSELASAKRINPKKILAEEIAARLNCTGENEELIRILARVCGIDVQRVEDLLASHRNRMLRLEKERAEEVKKALKEGRGIHGEAVRASLAADTVWADTQSSASETIMGEVRREIASQMGP